jgi:hypothetical protein
MSERLTWLDVERLNAKVLAAKMKREGKSPPEPEAYDGPEADLHDKIIAECQRRRWYCQTTRMDKKSTATKGACDFVIAASKDVNWDSHGGFADPPVFFIEAKRKGGKLSPEQTVTKHVLTALGHRYACVFSYAEFLSVIDA